MHVIIASMNVLRSRGGVQRTARMKRTAKLARRHARQEIVR